MPVRLVTPRSLRRLTRVMHAFGPATGALFAVLGAGAQERCFEDDLGLGGPIAIEGDAFIRAFEQALDGRGVPFGHVGGEDADVALDGARWVVCASTGGLKPALLQQLIDLAGRGTRVTIGPRKPERDGAMRPLMTPPDLTGVELLMADPPAVGLDPATVDRMVAKAIETLALPTFACDVAGVYATVHEDAAGKPRAVFVINPGPDDVVARVTVPSVQTARDALTEQNVHARAGTLEVRVPPRTVRLLAVTTGEP